MVYVKYSLDFIKLTNIKRKENKYKYLSDKFKYKHEYQII